MTKQNNNGGPPTPGRQVPGPRIQHHRPATRMAIAVAVATVAIVGTVADSPATVWQAHLGLAICAGTARRRRHDVQMLRGLAHAAWGALTAAIGAGNETWHFVVIAGPSVDALDQLWNDQPVIDRLHRFLHDNVNRPR